MNNSATEQYNETARAKYTLVGFSLSSAKLQSEMRILFVLHGVVLHLTDFPWRFRRPGCCAGRSLNMSKLLLTAANKIKLTDIHLPSCTVLDVSRRVCSNAV